MFDVASLRRRLHSSPATTRPPVPSPSTAVPSRRQCTADRTARIVTAARRVSPLLASMVTARSLARSSCGSLVMDASPAAAARSDLHGRFVSPQHFTLSTSAPYPQHFSTLPSYQHDPLSPHLSSPVAVASRCRAAPITNLIVIVTRPCSSHYRSLVRPGGLRPSWGVSWSTPA